MTDPRVVDWAAVERRGRRTDWLALPLLMVFFAALVALHDRWAVWEGAAAWVAISVLALLVAIGQLAALANPRLRSRSAQGHRIGYALRHRIDPGPELRSRVDVQARYLVGVGWLLWLVPIGPLGLLVGARWDRPVTTVPAALVVVGAAVLAAVWWRRRVGWARRWVEDPPGPERDVPPPGRRERWVTRPRSAVLAMAAVLVAGVLAGLLAALIG